MSRHSRQRAQHNAQRAARSPDYFRSGSALGVIRKVLAAEALVRLCKALARTINGLHLKVGTAMI
jgi:hypothetical protein